MEPVRVLFVDDDPSIRETLPTILRAQDFDVTSAGTVANALSEITSAQFDVLITDLNISYPAGGLIVVSTMRSMQPNCVTLILTGDSGVETSLERIENTVDGYLIKPVPIPALVSLIEETLRQRKPGTGAATKRIA
jgi:DNA-binding NtrC family response regulator